MSTVDAVFFALALLIAAGGVGVVLFSNVLYAAISLFAALVGVAGVFGLLGADFVMATQLLVYVGGILVLILFGVLLTTRIYEVKLRDRVFRPAWGIASGGALFVLLGAVILSADFGPGAARPVVPTTRVLGDLLLSKYLLPFEIVSVVLLAAIVSAAVLVRREVREEEERR